MKSKSLTLLFSAALWGQSTASGAQPQFFHVSGTTSDPIGAVVPGTEVVFQSKEANKSVTSDSQGFYQADLPFGSYTMTAKAQGDRYRRGFGTYRRPLFRVASAASLILNVTLPVLRISCDVIVTDASVEEATEARKNACGGEDLFSLSSADGVPFELYIRYPTRSHGNGGYVYSSSQTAVNVEEQVLVEYNLFTLQADRVVYDSGDSSVQAIGHVVFVNDSGATQSTDAMTLKLESGRAVPFQRR